MKPQPTIPDVGDWLAGALRGLHPARWLLSLLGLAFTALVLVLLQAWLEEQPPRWQNVWLHPGDEAQTLAEALHTRSLGHLIFHLAPVLIALSACWCLIAGWIARHELLARASTRPRPASSILEPGPTAFVASSAKSLFACCPMILGIALMVLLPVLLAGVLNGLMGGPGAIVVALALPLLLLASLVLLMLALGVLAWPLMPVALAAECSDGYDAVGRAYNYLFQRPISFLFLTAAALALAAPPLALPLFLFPEPPAGWSVEGWQTLLWIAAALSVSVFLSLETRVYLHLRAELDETDADEIATEGDRRSIETRKDQQKTDEPKPAAPAVPARPFSLLGTVAILLAMLGSWCLTFWLLTQASSGSTAWLSWGLGETFSPQVEGLRWVASRLAAVWGVIWLLLPLLVAARRLRGQMTEGQGDGKTPGR